MQAFGFFVETFTIVYLAIALVFLITVYLHYPKGFFIQEGVQLYRESQWISNRVAGVKDISPCTIDQQPDYEKKIREKMSFAELLSRMHFYVCVPDVFVFQNTNRDLTPGTRQEDFFWCIEVEEKAEGWEMFLQGYFFEEWETTISPWESTTMTYGPKRIYKPPLRAVRYPNSPVLREQTEFVTAENVSNIRVFRIEFEWEDQQLFEISTRTEVFDENIIPSGGEEIWDISEIGTNEEWVHYIEMLVHHYGWFIRDFFIVTCSREGTPMKGWTYLDCDTEPVLINWWAEQIVFERSCVGMSPMVIATQLPMLLDIILEPDDNVSEFNTFVNTMMLPIITCPFGQKEM